MCDIVITSVILQEILKYPFSSVIVFVLFVEIFAADILLLCLSINTDSIII